jgi:carbonic anhydrase
MVKMFSEIIKKILEGNIEFANKKLEDDYIRCENIQTPKITLITCSDSRIPGSIYSFDTTNYIFCIRDIGNQIKTVQGSVDYGILHLKTPILMILGHTGCGAIKAACSDYSNEPASIKRELDTLKEPVSSDIKEGDELLKKTKLSQENVDYQVNLALNLYKDKVDNNNLLIIGAIFDIHGVYKGKRGEFYIINVNGEKDIDKMKEILNSIDSEVVDKKVKRL